MVRMMYLLRERLVAPTPDAEAIEPLLLIVMYTDYQPQFGGDITDERQD